MDIDKIPVKLLKAVRYRMGAKDSADTKFDKEIETLSPIELIRMWHTFNLGSAKEMDQAVEWYEELMRLSNE